MSCRPVIFDPLEWTYVYTLAKRLLPELSFDRDLEATHAAAGFPGESIEALRDFDWCCPAIYMPPFERLISGSVTVAVEGYTAEKLARRGVKPDVVVSDFDFNPQGVGLGRIAVIHVHGDNYWLVPSGPYVYTVQTWPMGCTANVSGFTDGDRAVYLAYYMGAREIAISGFNPEAPVKRGDLVKRKKLALASHLLNRLSRRVAVRFV
ncbi:6-hydroxymethylpterin diphosphokinase MptE-like protein [Pyrobaculum ferrireducens]|uniref:Uncharacterized protein n=1 Tax=Pyrobaculum ferrireducens TaxID=1104324 RepID=G7VHD0_9CREN|nr:6-hydroxymethylpterin diphosphokinase MptE-like protein [Pyrobaculum ferrireducens]AET32033.1 hypothetical protein P186_0581 [Pyrobaculum ferrireducens]